jgi:hypothetical protein
MRALEALPVGAYPLLDLCMGGTIILLILLGAGIGLLLWWGSRLPPTRPRPRSRHRGETLMDVHQRLRKKSRSR